jgi:hypothetical protein
VSRQAVRGRHLPPDRNAGDESTLGGYMAVHARPAAFDGPDGMPYSVEIMVDKTDDPAQPFAAYLLFLQWRRMGQPGIDAHVETDYVARDATEDGARNAAGGMSLHDVKAALDALVNARAGNDRKWWDAMTDEEDEKTRRREDET